MRALLTELEQSPELLAARARGVSAGVIANRYVLGNAAPQLAGLAGVALVMGFGACIPVEALCDVPGIGQLAWQAAQARDLPVLCALALVASSPLAAWAAEADSHHQASVDYWSLLFVFVLSTFIGIGAIGRVSRLSRLRIWFRLAGDRREGLQERVCHRPPSRGFSFARWRGGW